MPDTLLEPATHTVLTFAALCRLAFATIATDDDLAEPGSSAPSQSIISQTAMRGRRGRPRTARWAFWTALLVRDHGLPSRRPLTSRDLADLVSLLTRQAVPPTELRAQLGRLRREADAHARAAGEALLESPLKWKLSERAYVKQARDYLGVDLEPRTQYPPMIVNGQLNEAGHVRLAAVRRAILRAVR